MESGDSLRLTMGARGAQTSAERTATGHTETTSGEPHDTRGTTAGQPRDNPWTTAGQPRGPAAVNPTRRA
eukprot:8499913-Pyramimonas_sp.AAC.1